jgi:hypothetical protein
MRWKKIQIGRPTASEMGGLRRLTHLYLYQTRQDVLEASLLPQKQILYKYLEQEATPFIVHVGYATR